MAHRAALTRRLGVSHNLKVVSTWTMDSIDIKLTFKQCIASTGLPNISEVGHLMLSGHTLLS
jgi:hypothetical protein